MMGKEMQRTQPAGPVLPARVQPAAGAAGESRAPAPRPVAEKPAAAAPRRRRWDFWVYPVAVGLLWVVWHIVFRFKVIGRENLPRGRQGFVLAPNHISAIDPIFVVLARFWGRRMVVMAKEELFEINPLFTWFFRAVNVIPVHRGRGDTAVVDRAIEDVRSEGRGLLIFPEGTRSKDGSLGRLKSGAFVVASAAGVPIVPCRVIYAGGKMKLFGRCTVVFGKPIPAEQLYLGEERSAARLRACKQLLHDELEQLLEENRQYA